MTRACYLARAGSLKRMCHLGAIASGLSVSCATTVAWFIRRS